MVNNSTNIHKTYTHLSRSHLKSLNTHLSPQIIEHKLTSKHWTPTSHLKSLNTHLSPQIIEHSPLTSNHWTPTSHLKSLNTHLSPQIIEHPPLTSNHWTQTLTSNHWTPTSHLKSLNTNSHLKSLNTKFIVPFCSCWISTIDLFLLNLEWLIILILFEISAYLHYMGKIQMEATWTDKS